MIKIKGKYLYCQKIKLESTAFGVELNDEYAERTNQAKILEVGVDVVDTDYKQGVVVYFPAQEAIPVEQYPDNIIIDSEAIVGVEQ
jgi:hypothetical protein